MHSPKEVMFLNELEEILDVIEPAEFQKVCFTGQMHIIIDECFEGDGAVVQPVDQVCQQSTFPSGRESALLLEQRVSCSLIFPTNVQYPKQ